MLLETILYFSTLFNTIVYCVMLLSVLGASIIGSSDTDSGSECDSDSDSDNDASSQTSDSNQPLSQVSRKRSAQDGSQGTCITHRCAITLYNTFTFGHGCIFNHSQI